MTINEFISDNFVMIYELGGLVILLFVSAHISFSMKRKTLIAIGLMFIELVCYIAERWTQTFPSYTVLRPILTATLYSVYPSIIIVMMVLTSTNINKKLFALLMIPEAVCVPIFYTSQWTHIVFYYYESNHYAGGFLSYLPYNLFIFYVIVFLIHNLVFLKHSSRVSKAVAAYITLGPLIGALIIMALDIDKDYSALFTSGTLLYFTYLYIHMAKIDPLTNLLNRQSYYQDIEVDEKYITGVVSIDMNDLKYLNDTFGHEAGDNALKTVAGTIRANSGRNSTVYRVGGDEFMIFYIGAGEDVIRKAIENIRCEMNKTEYVCAYGYAMVAEGKTITESIKISDQRMYTDKAELKKIRNLNAAIRP